MYSDAEKRLAAETVLAGLATKPQAVEILKELNKKAREGVVSSFAAECATRGIATPEKLAAIARTSNLIADFNREDDLYADIALENGLLTELTIKTAAETITSRLETGTLSRIYEYFYDEGFLQDKIHAGIIQKMTEALAARKKGKEVPLKVAQLSDILYKVELKKPEGTQQESDLWTVHLKAEGLDLSLLPAAAVKELIYSGRLAPTDLIGRSFEPAGSRASENPAFRSVFIEAGRIRKPLLNISPRIVLLAGAVIVAVVGIFVIKATRRGEDRAPVGLITELKEDVAGAERLIEKGSRLNPRPWRLAERKLTEARGRIRELRKDPNVKGELDAISAEVDRLQESDELAHFLKGEYYIEQTGEWLKKRDYGRKIDELEIERRKALGYKYLKRPGFSEVDNWLSPDEYDRMTGKIEFGGALVFPEVAATQIIEADAMPALADVPRVADTGEFRTRVLAGDDPEVMLDAIIANLKSYNAGFSEHVAELGNMIGGFFSAYDHNSNAAKISREQFEQLRKIRERNKVCKGNLAAGKLLFGDEWFTGSEFVAALAEMHRLCDFEGKWVLSCRAPFITKCFDGISEKVYIIELKGRAPAKGVSYRYDGDYILIKRKLDSTTPMQFPRDSVVSINEEANEEYLVLSAVGTYPLDSTEPFLQALEKAEGLKLTDWAPLISAVINYIDPEYDVIDLTLEERLKSAYKQFKYAYMCIDDRFYEIPRFDLKANGSNDGGDLPQEYKNLIRDGFDGFRKLMVTLQKNIDAIKRRMKKLTGKQRKEAKDELERTEEELEELEKKVEREERAKLKKGEIAWDKGIPAIQIGAFGGVTGFRVEEILAEADIIIAEIFLPDPCGGDDTEDYSTVRLLGCKDELRSGQTVRFKKPYPIIVFAHGTYKPVVTGKPDPDEEKRMKYNFLAVPLEYVRRGLSFSEFTRLAKAKPELLGD